VFNGNQAYLGGAFSAQGANIDTYSCTVAGNQSAGAALFVQGGDLRLEQTIVAHNTGLAAWVDPGAEIYLASCDLFGNQGGDWTAPFASQLDLRGNFLAPPCFCDLDAGVLTLCADSSCLPANNPHGDDILLGALGAGCEACFCDGAVSGADDAVIPPVADLTLAAHPNPFNPATTLIYRVDQAGPVSLVVFDLRGRRVATLLQASVAVGDGQVTWNGRDDEGRAVEAGTYLCRLECVGGVRTVPLALVK
jgi:hypothetical protein